MRRSRRQFTLRQLMTVVAVVGFEAFLYASYAKASVINGNDSSTLYVIALVLLANVFYGVLCGLIHAAFFDRTHPERFQRSGPTEMGDEHGN